MTGPESRRGIVLIVAAVLVCGGMFTASAHAQDFFSALFGGFAPPPPPQAYRNTYRDTYRSHRAMSYASTPDDEIDTSRGGGQQAWCVRTCDGRYFPLNADGNEQSACTSFCPASETEVYYGSGAIDDSESDKGKPYTRLPNAFRFRKELVAGCTCNGKDAFGLARIPVEQDKTLQKGDIVATKDGLMMATASGGKSRTANLAPLPRQVRSRFARLPQVASD